MELIETIELEITHKRLQLLFWEQTAAGAEAQDREAELEAAKNARALLRAMTLLEKRGIPAFIAPQAESDEPGGIEPEPEPVIALHPDDREYLLDLPDTPFNAPQIDSPEANTELVGAGLGVAS